MRLRNIKNAQDIIEDSPYLIKKYSKQKKRFHLIFQNSNPIHIEIGCGKGDFIIENAKRYPYINFIGIEKQASVLVSVVKKLNDEKIPNLRIICMDASEIDTVFDKEIAKIYLNFSDPWPKKKHTDRRLSSFIFLKKYDNLFESDCQIEMKTDNLILFEYSLVTFSQYGYILEEVFLNLYENMPLDNIATEYEKKFASKGMTIYKVKTIKKNVKK